MFNITTNYTGKLEYYKVSPTATFEYGRGVEVNQQGLIEPSLDGSYAFGIADDRQDHNGSTCLNGEIRVWSGDFIFETDQFIDFGSNNTTKYSLQSFLTLENGIWKPDRSLTSIICGIVVDYPNAQNNFLLAIRSTFPLDSSMIKLPTLFPVNYNNATQLDFEWNDPVSTQQVPRSGVRGGAICEECNTENEYLEPTLNYICRSCRSYKEM